MYAYVGHASCVIHHILHPALQEGEGYAVIAKQQLPQLPAVVARPADVPYAPQPHTTLKNDAKVVGLLGGRLDYGCLVGCLVGVGAWRARFSKQECCLEAL